MSTNGYTLGELQRLAQDCDDWSVLIGGLCTRRLTGNDDDDDELSSLYHHRLDLNSTTTVLKELHYGPS